MIEKLTWGSLPLVILGAILILACGRGEAPAEPGEPGASETVRRDAKGGGVDVELDQKAQERAGIRTTTIRATTHRRDLVAYGALEEDSSTVYVLRAPLAGVPTREVDRSWPVLGEQLADGTIVGHIRPRFAASERIALEERLFQASAEVEAAEAGVETARAAYERARILNADDKNISDRVLQEARERVVSQEARWEAARKTRAAIDSALESGSRKEAVPLHVERGGEVVELLAHPGEDVQAGDPILRTARFDNLLARVFVPAAENIPRELGTARIVAVGTKGTVLTGALVASVPGGTAQHQGRTLLYRLPAGTLQLRPGMGVTAHLPIEGESRRGVMIPRDAVIRHMGMTFVYVQQGDNRFARRPVPELEPAEGGYFVPSGLAEGDRVVAVGAGVLLGEEMKSLIPVGEED